jgi:hypothetical protein
MFQTAIKIVLTILFLLCLLDMPYGYFQIVANAFGSTFAFFANTQTNAKKCKRATKPTHHDTTNKRRNEQTKKALGHNRGLKMGAEVLNSTFVLLMNICAKLNICASNSPLRQAPKLC